MVLMKFTDHNGNPTYVNMSNIAAISEHTTYDDGLGKEVSGTSLMCANGFSIAIREHISEVLALIEGRDPRPARILFGKK